MAESASQSGSEVIFGTRKRSSGDEAARGEGFGTCFTPLAGCRADNDRTGGESGFGFVHASLCLYLSRMAMNWNRREFLAATGALALTALNAGRLEAAPDKRRNQRIIYRYSVHGRRASRAAKAFCANLRFRTREAAGKYPKPHKGFNGKLVEVVVSSAEYQFLFTTRHADAADRRHLRNLKMTGLG